MSVGGPVPGESSWRIDMLSLFRRLMKDDRGATVIEYVLITSLIAVAAIASMRTVGGKISSILGHTASTMN
jgi:pilus assembly protein Flp/PilA